MKSLVDRIWEKLDRNGPMCAKLGTPCWIWQGSKDRDGYGQVAAFGSTLAVHRLVNQLSYGEITDGSHVLHHCDRPSCCRPSHTFRGTHQANMADCAAKGRMGQQNGKAVRGERHGNSTRSDAEVAEMLAWVRSDFRQADVAQAFGVSRQSLSRWVRGERRRVRPAR